MGIHCLIVSSLNNKFYLLFSPTTRMDFNAQTSKIVLEKYLSLPQGSRVQATYIWIDGTGQGIRSKTKTLETKPGKVEDLPVWNYDGSSCYQAEGSNSDTYIHPVKMYPCPFRQGDNVIVLCDAYKYKQAQGLPGGDEEGRKVQAMVWDRAGVHAPGPGWPSFRLAQEWLPWGTGPLLLWQWGWKGLWQRCGGGALQVLHVRWNQNLWYKR